MKDDLELTELEAFQQEQLDILANALAHRGVCVRGDSVHCYDSGGYCSCQECWLGWAGEKAKRLLKGERHD